MENIIKFVENLPIMEYYQNKFSSFTSFLRQSKQKPCHNIISPIRAYNSLPDHINIPSYLNHEVTDCLNLNPSGLGTGFRVALLG